jgi:hypothetical protein
MLRALARSGWGCRSLAKAWILLLISSCVYQSFEKWAGLPAETVHFQTCIFYTFCYDFNSA